MAYEIQPFGKDYFDLTPSELFRDFGRQFFNSVPDGISPGGIIKSDIIEKEDRYELTAELPGFTKDSIHITYDNGVLAIKAEKQSESEQKNEEGKVLQKERSYSNMSRMFTIRNVDDDNIKAVYKDGVLSLILPKLEKNKRKTIEISDGLMQDDNKNE